MRGKRANNPADTHLVPGASAGDGASAPRHILFPYRPSRRGDRALRAAAQLAHDSGARLTVLAAVINQEKGRRCCGLQGQRWVELLREAAADDLDRARRVLGPNPKATFAWAEGEVFRDIVRRFAREHGCDMTVMAPSIAGALAARSGQSRDVRGLKVQALPR